MKLTINELEQIFTITIKWLKEERVKEISFEDMDNFYMKIWHKDIDFDDSEFMKCPRYTIGSLREDIKDLKDILSGEYDFVFLDLQKLGALLTKLGETI